MNKVRKNMNFDGQITYNGIIFYYTFINKRKIKIDSRESIKLGILVKVREEILQEIKTKTEITHDIVFEFKTLVR